MLHPDQFAVNEVWIAFRLNEELIKVRDQGGFSVVALMEASSCFIMGSSSYHDDGTKDITVSDAIALLKQGYAHKKELAKTLFLPSNYSGTTLAAVAEQQDIKVVRVPEDQLLAFIGEARQSFKEWAR